MKCDELADSKREFEGEKKRALELFSKIANSDLEINKSRKELNDLKREKGQLEEKLMNFNGMIDDLVGQLKEKEQQSPEDSELSKLKARFFESRQEILKKTEEIRILKLEILSLKGEIERLNGQLDMSDKEKESFSTNFELLKSDCEKIVRSANEKRKELLSKIAEYEAFIGKSEFSEEIKPVFVKENENFNEIDELERCFAEKKQAIIEAAAVNSENLIEKRNSLAEKEINLSVFSPHSAKRQLSKVAKKEVSKREAPSIKEKPNREISTISRPDIVENGEMKKKKETFKQRFDRNMTKSMIDVGIAQKLSQGKEKTMTDREMKEKEQKKVENTKISIQRENLEKNTEKDRKIKILEKNNEKIEQENLKNSEKKEKNLIEKKIDKIKEKKTEKTLSKQENPELKPSEKNFEKSMENLAENRQKSIKTPESSLQKPPFSNSEKPFDHSFEKVSKEPVIKNDLLLEKDQKKAIENYPKESKEDKIVSLRDKNSRYKTPDSHQSTSQSLKNEKFDQLIRENAGLIQEAERNKGLIADLELRITDLANDKSIFLQEKADLLAKIADFESKRYDFEEKRSVFEVKASQNTLEKPLLSRFEKTTQTSFSLEKIELKRKKSALALKDLAFFEEKPNSYSQTSKFAFEHIRSADNLLINLNFSKLKEIGPEPEKSPNYPRIYESLRKMIEKPILIDSTMDKGRDFLGFERFFREKRQPKYEEFEEIMVKVVEEHQLCGKRCPHLRRFYERIGISETKERRPVLKIHKRDLSKLPKIPNNGVF